MRSRTIVITGGSGLLGLNWAITRREKDRIVLVRHRREVTLPGVESLSVDLASVDAVRIALDEVEADLCVHTAGMTSVEACEAHPVEARRVNAGLADSVACACAGAGIPMVHISTDHLFSGTRPFCDEACPVEPQNVYARTKFEGECRVAETHSKALIVRTNFYGWGPAYRPSFSDWIIRTLRANERITLFEDAWYTPILMSRLIQATHELVDLGASGLFNVVGDERLSKYDFGVQLASRFELDAGLIDRGRLSEYDAPVKRPLDMSLDNRKLRNRLGRDMGNVDALLTELRQQESEFRIG